MSAAHIEKKSENFIRKNENATMTKTSVQIIADDNAPVTIHGDSIKMLVSIFEQKIGEVLLEGFDDAETPEYEYCLSYRPDGFEAFFEIEEGEKVDDDYHREIHLL